jgi:hypothetical protein
MYHTAAFSPVASVSSYAAMQPVRELTYPGFAMLNRSGQNGGLGGGTVLTEKSDLGYIVIRRYIGGPDEELP